MKLCICLLTIFLIFCNFYCSSNCMDSYYGDREEGYSPKSYSSRLKSRAKIQVGKSLGRKPTLADFGECLILV